MTPRGLVKLTAIADNIEAWSDWRQVEAEAQCLGLHQLAEQLKPANDAGWRAIDAQTRKLRAEMRRRCDGTQYA